MTSLLIGSLFKVIWFPEDLNINVTNQLNSQQIVLTFYLDFHVKCKIIVSGENKSNHQVPCPTFAINTSRAYTLSRHIQSVWWLGQFNSVISGIYYAICTREICVQYFPIDNTGRARDKLDFTFLLGNILFHRHWFCIDPIEPNVALYDL